VTGGRKTDPIINVYLLRLILLLTAGRTWKGTAFGGYKSRDEVPQLVAAYQAGSLPIDHYITHRYGRSCLVPSRTPLL
jgi:Zn-dependent alcohol dehydrogenase